MRSTWVLLLVVLTGGVGACSRTHEPSHDRPVPVVASPSAGNLPTLNVPELLDLSIDEMSRRLGQRLSLPVGFVDPVQIPQRQRGDYLDSMALFRHRGLALVVAYNDRTRRVSDLLLLGSDEELLMSRARLRLGAGGYLVLPVFQERHPTRLLGLRVVAVALPK